MLGLNGCKGRDCTGLDKPLHWQHPKNTPVGYILQCADAHSFGGAGGRALALPPGQSAVARFPGDGVVGVVQAFQDKPGQVAVRDAVDHPATDFLRADEAAEAKLGQVLAD